MKDLETGHDIDRPGVMLEKRNEGAQRQSGRLTSDEIEILAMVATGATDREIADKLHLSQEAVKARVEGIFKKINAPNRFQASLWAVMNL
jgi:DNA-binding NarL/FixJ family response regulator